MSETENCEIYGKCNNPHGHGHNYALEVTASGAIDHETGMVCDLSALDEFVQQNVAWNWIIGWLDLPITADPFLFRCAVG